MKIYIPNHSAAEETKVELTELELSKKEWQDFLQHVCQSIEDRRKLIQPKSFRPKDKKSKV